MLENFGIGIDLVDINRFKNLPYDKNKNFYNKIFSQYEIEYCLKFKDLYSHFAGKFAIKEATKKSLKQQLDFLDIETFHKDSKPQVKLHKNINQKFLVSLSHDGNYSIAFVISEIQN